MRLNSQPPSWLPMADFWVSVVVAIATVAAILLAVVGVLVAYRSVKVSQEQHLTQILQDVGLSVAKLSDLSGEFQANILRSWSDYDNRARESTRIRVEPRRRMDLSAFELDQVETEFRAFAEKTTPTPDLALWEATKSRWVKDMMKTYDTVWLAVDPNRSISESDIYLSPERRLSYVRRSSIVVYPKAYPDDEEPESPLNPDSQQQERDRDAHAHALAMHITLEHMTSALRQIEINASSVSSARPSRSNARQRRRSDYDENSTRLESHLRRLVREARWVRQCSHQLWLELGTPAGQTNYLPMTARDSVLSTLFGIWTTPFNAEAELGNAARWIGDGARIQVAHGDAITSESPRRYYLVIDGVDHDIDSTVTLAGDLSVDFGTIRRNGHRVQVWNDPDDFRVLIDRNTHALASSADWAHLPFKPGQASVAGVTDIWLYQSMAWLSEALIDFVAAQHSHLRGEEIPWAKGSSARW